ncbi:cell envelope integrity protein CreD [Sphingomicrobium clamense]|uniref:Cell envelope integrity protein CreD n=1 Tax=Sphingomicrobium clamense TaxID=2851013 RepID=A0ABS6V4J0_9SPHN|nr:cell envelope integrity protein CreD [Sphingomicrobium sp. B8]MBW0144275.1 cell envelope integrity protein CreD [Sphingomicrobium sp. B8]
MGWRSGEKTPGQKLAIAILVGLLLAIPLFSVWALVYDRQTQSQAAVSSITEGWGGEQALAGPVLAIPYTATRQETRVEDGRRITTARQVTSEMILSPEALDLDIALDPDRRKRSIYEAVVYDGDASGQARFAFPPDLDRYDIDPDSLRLDDAELRFGISDPKGLGANPEVSVDGTAQRLQPGGGSKGGSGFFAFVDASALRDGAMVADFSYGFRGSSAVALKPTAGSTRWKVSSPWPHPSFTGAFIPDEHSTNSSGFDAQYRIGNLSLGKSLVNLDGGNDTPRIDRAGRGGQLVDNGHQLAVIDLIQPVDLYSRVNRATKYGFLHIGFTFLALLMFDVIGGRRISAVAYLLVGAALVLFFVLLLAFAEVIGFAPAYVVASLAIVGLVTAYSAAILGSWRRAIAVSGLLALLYAALYILLGLEEFSLLIGSLMIFAALAAVMYTTRNLDWSRERALPEEV